jgi:hypothetical protein
MSLLQLKDETAVRKDASSTGEDYAKGSSHILVTTIIAFVVITISIAGFLLADRKPPVAAGEVTQVWVHPVHTLNVAHDANGVASEAAQFDQVLVFGHLRVRNESKERIIVKNLYTNATLEDGVHSSAAAMPVDYDRVFIAYPELASLKSNTLSRDSVIEPGQVLDGMTVSAFHVSKEQWATRKDLNFSVEFKFHPDLVLQPAGTLVEK